MASQPVYTKEELDAIAKSTMRCFIDFARQWGLTHAEAAALIELSEETLQELIDKPELMLTSMGEKELWRAIDELLSIALFLYLLDIDSSRAAAWIKKPNFAPQFAGASVLEFLLRNPAQNRSIVLDYLWSVGCGDFS